MILQSMTPEEKVKQMQHLKPYVYDYAMAWATRNYNIIRRTKVFPTMYTFDREVQGMGTWTMVATAESKANIRKNIIAMSAYQKFHVPHAKDRKNIGTGIFLFEGTDDGITLCLEFSPHCFLRFRQRMIEPKGITQPPFPQLVKRVLAEHHNGMDTTIKGYKAVRDNEEKVRIVKTDENDRYQGYDNLITYTKNGLFLGMAAAERKYFCYTTFVSNDELFENQREEQQRMMKERMKDDFEHRNTPFRESKVNHRWMLADGKTLTDWK